MMTQEDEDLEEELQKLDIREDHGDEDSDVTPTNTPPGTPPVLYIKKYPPPNKNSFHDLKDVARASRPEECDSRTESSMSWGDDEFEGEATRQVSVLFDQLDNLLYKEDGFLSPIPYADYSSSLQSSFSHTPLPEQSLPKDPQQDSEALSECSEQLLSTGQESAKFEPGDGVYDVEDATLSSEILCNSENSWKYHHSDTFITEEPSQELKEECSSWVHQFPHYRVRGRQVNLELLKLFDKLVSDDLISSEENDEDEEVIATDGDFYHLLPLVTFSSANQTKTPSSEESRKESSQSRVCSGSNDPEVLKEQVLILLFDKLWSAATAVIEPLLHQYARYVIEQSVQYSSLSREPSTRGNRLGALVSDGTARTKVSGGGGDDLGASSDETTRTRVSGVGDDSGDVGGSSNQTPRTNNKHPLPLPSATLSSNVAQRPVSGSYRTRDASARHHRPLSGVRRPSSAANRLLNHGHPPLASSVHEVELQDLLQVTSKPLQHHDDISGRPGTSSNTINTRGSSAHSLSSQLSLPSLTMPRTPSHRPLSSVTTSHLLTPIRVDSRTSVGEQRPASTSSYNSRTRFHERLHHYGRQSTIQELRRNSIELDIEEEPGEITNSTWSRHISFLPPIVDEADPTSNVSPAHQPVRRNLSRRRDSSTERPFSHVHEAQQQPQTPLMTGESGQPSTLSVRGTPLTPYHAHKSLAARNHRMAARIRPVEPFLSWVMEHVDRDPNLHRQQETRRFIAKNAFVKEESKNAHMMTRTKYFRRFSHH